MNELEKNFTELPPETIDFGNLSQDQIRQLEMLRAVSNRNSSIAQLSTPTSWPSDGVSTTPSWNATDVQRTESSDVIQTPDDTKEEIEQKEEVKTSKVAPEIKPIRKRNFRIQRSFQQDLEGKQKLDYDKEVLFLPSGTEQQVREVASTINEKEIATTKQGKKWVGVVSAASDMVVYDDGFIPTASESDADFVQGVETESGILTASTPSFKAKEGTTFSGEKARIRVRQALRLGSIFSIPLWHSGFWIRFKAPPEGELLELYRQITADKTTLGRATYGLIFSNNTSYATKALMDFFVDNIYDTSLALGEEENILDYISVLDVPACIWGMACAIWPNGFQYLRGCINDPNKCTHVTQAWLDLSALQFTNQAQLTAKQKAHMTKRGRAVMSKDAVVSYREEFIRGIDKEVNISPEISIVLTVPSVLDHLEAGYRWVSSIEEKYGRALTQDENRRDAYLLNQGKATTLRQYSHFIASINVAGDVYDDIETVEELLGDITSDDVIRNEVLKRVKDYIDSVQISLIAIPAFDCPSCGMHQGDKESKYPELIPIDATNVFFTLTVQRVQRVEAR